MDPLSITASIIAVLQATNAIISVCYDYSAVVKGSSSELSRVTEEVKSLRNLLESVAQLAEKAESADSNAESQLPTLKLFCKPDVGQLASGQVGSKRRRLIHALGWLLKEGETKKTPENIERFKATLNLALTVDQANLTQTIRDATLQTQRGLTKLDQSLASMAIDDQREKIYNWLSAPDPSLNQNQARKRRYSKTGTWFIESEWFVNWKANPDSLLWLHGIPGCGKTILASTIIEDVIQHCSLGRNSSLPVAYFYFDFNDSEKQKYEKMIRSLITQLSKQSVRTRALESLFSSYQGSRQPTADALLETLRHIVQEFDESFIILDTLDECEERQGLLEDIEEIA
ncbi:hypothetical protein BDD12DRAFT_875826 [Trichophaea hybrida]|nr:hypothetical protein BDD12DRAFT_875826 [Trichophaea hybrida]